MQPPSEGKPLPGHSTNRQPLDPLTILKQGWRLTMSSLPVYIPALVAAFGIVFCLNAAFTYGLMHYFPQLEEQQVFVRSVQLLSILIAPLEAGCIMMGVNLARGRPIRVMDIFARFSQSALVIITSLLMAFVTQIGLYLLWVPGIFLLVALSMTIPLVLDRRLSPLQAMKLSVVTLTPHWFKLLTLYMVCIVLILLGAMMFGVGVLVAIPFFLNVKGVLYQRLFAPQGVEGETSQDTAPDQFEA